MTDLDDLLAGHVRGLFPAQVPPLGPLRRRAARRRRSKVLGTAAVLLGVLGLGLSLGPGATTPDRVEFADPALEPRDPAPGLGALSGRVQPTPEGAQRPVTLVFKAESGSGRFTVETQQSEAWTIDLPAGTYRITAEQGGGVCNSQVSVSADAWSRQDVAWPCLDPTQPLTSSVLLETPDLVDTYGGPWTVDDAFRDAGLPAGCPASLAPDSLVERSFEQRASGVRVSQRVLRYPDLTSALAAQGALIDAIEACEDTRQQIVGSIPGSSTQLTYGRTTGQPDTWFVSFVSDYSLVQAAVTTPDSTEEQAVLAVKALMAAARTAARGD